MSRFMFIWCGGIAFGYAAARIIDYAAVRDFGGVLWMSVPLIFGISLAVSARFNFWEPLGEKHG